MVLVCLHIYEPSLILIHIDELQPFIKIHLLYIFCECSFWTCILFELSTLDDIHTEHLMMHVNIKHYHYLKQNSKIIFREFFFFLVDQNYKIIFI